MLQNVKYFKQLQILRTSRHMCVYIFSTSNFSKDQQSQNHLPNKKVLRNAGSNTITDYLQNIEYCKYVQ